MATVTSPPPPEAAIDAFPPESAVPPDDMLYEIIDGQFVEKAVGAYEIDLANLLQDLLSPFARANRLGRVMMEMVFDLRPAVPRGRRPDVAFLSAARWPLDRRAPRVHAWPVAPDLAVEVVSPGNSAREIQGKIAEYFLAGVVRVWIVYPDTETVYLYESPTSVRIFARGDTLSDEAILPGFRLDLAEFFGPPA